jgi:copper oxidase (laccase) domain-containing protein
MQQIYHPYYNWECFKNGMYSESGNIDQAILVLSNDALFDTILSEVIMKWVVSAENHLTNNLINRQAWCGQVACCYKFGVGEIVTRKAWARLKNIERYKANKIATKHIKNYERTHRKLHNRMGIEMLQIRNTRSSTKQDKSIRESPFIQTDLFGYS